MADATDRCEFRIWGYGVGPALTALVRAGRALDRPELIDGVARRIAPVLDRRADPTDHLIPVEVLRSLDTGAGAEAAFRDAVLAAVRPVAGRPDGAPA